LRKRKSRHPKSGALRRFGGAGMAAIRSLDGAIGVLSIGDGSGGCAAL
jgi:hypothetical protein